MPKLSVAVLNDKKKEIPNVRHDLIEFGTIYSHTTLQKFIKVTNNSPEKTTFNASILQDQEGELMGETSETTAMEALYNTSFHKKQAQDSRIQSKYDAFKITPNTGFLSPGQSSIITIEFQPKLHKNNPENDEISKKDFVVFMTIHTGNWSEEIGDSIKAIASPCEVALVGSVTNPSISLTKSINFENKLKVGDKETQKFQIKNNASIPIDIKLSKIPHFNITPNTFKILPENSKNIEITFSPKHDGEFDMKVMASLMPGNGSDQILNKNYINLSGKSYSTPKINLPKNEELTFKESREVKSKSKNPRKLALLESTLHDQENDSDFIALPNDLSQSIRPYLNSEKYKTPFTRQPRYQYIDPDYAFTAEEAEERSQHKDQYTIKRDKKKLVAERQEENFKKLAETSSANNTAKTTESKIKNSISSFMNKKLSTFNRPKKPVRLHSASSRASIIQNSMSTEPILINPSVIDFGNICVGTNNQKTIVIQSNIKKTATVLFDSDSNELRQTHPSLLSLDPKQIDELHVIFNSDAPGIFERCISYNINNKPVGRIFIKANVVQPNINFYHKHDVIDTPTSQNNGTFEAKKIADLNQIKLTYPSMNKHKAEAFITLKNTTNAPTCFKFSKIEEDNSFFVTPEVGQMMPYSEFECRITFSPAFDSNFLNTFKCDISYQAEGEKTYVTDSKYLFVSAPNPPPVVKLVEPRLVWGLIPFGVESKRIIALTNESNYPATYNFNNIDSILPSTFKIEKPSSVIPANSTLLIATTFTPNEIRNFDYRIHISVGKTSNRNSRVKQKYELRMVGAVQKPSIKLSHTAFSFGAAPSGATVPLNFTVQNESPNTIVIVNFETDNECNFEKARAFTLSKNRLELSGGELVNMTLYFKPNNVASYNFDLNYTVNGIQDKIRITAVSARAEINIPQFIKPGERFEIEEMMKSKKTQFQDPITGKIYERLERNESSLAEVFPPDAGKLEFDAATDSLYFKHHAGLGMKTEFSITMYGQFTYKVEVKTVEDEIISNNMNQDTQIIIFPSKTQVLTTKLQYCSEKKMRDQSFDVKHIKIISEVSNESHDGILDFELLHDNHVKIQVNEKFRNESFNRSYLLNYKSTKISKIIIIKYSPNSYFTGEISNLAIKYNSHASYLTALKSWILNFVNLDDSISKARRVLDFSKHDMKGNRKKDIVNDSGIDFLINRIIQKDNHEEARFKPISLNQLDVAYANLVEWLAEKNGVNVNHIPAQSLLKPHELVREDLSIGNFAEEKSLQDLLNYSIETFDYLAPHLDKFQFEFLLEFYKNFVFDKVDTNLDRFYDMLLQVDDDLYDSIFEDEILKQQELEMESRMNELDEMSVTSSSQTFSVSNFNTATSKLKTMLYAINKLWNLHKNRLFPADLAKNTDPIQTVECIEDLNTGAVLGILITTFCPWLEELALKLFPQKYEKLSFENRAHNVNILFQLLSCAGLTNRMEFDTEDMLGPQGPNLMKIVLLLTHLWQKIPTRNPGEVVEFFGQLSETEEKEVRLTNSYDYPIQYHIQVLGPGKDCFKLLNCEEILNLPARTTKPIKLQATSNLLNTQEAILYINNIGKKNTAPFTMLDLLSSNKDICTFSFCYLLRIEPRTVVPTDNFEFTATLYHPLKISLPVKNPFSHLPNTPKYRKFKDCAQGF